MKHLRVQVDKLAFAVAMLGLAFFAAASYGECVNDANPNNAVIKEFMTSNKQNIFDQGAWILQPGMVVSFTSTEQNHTQILIRSISPDFIKSLPAQQGLLLQGFSANLSSKPIPVPVDLCSDNHKLSLKLLGSTLNITPAADGFGVKGKFMGVALQTNLVRAAETTNAVVH